MLDKEFKTAIQNLSSNEKDKLIFRLLKRDLDLANKLYFELVDTDSVEDKRKIIEIEIQKYAKRISENYYSPGYLLIEMRFMSGKITEHVKITKDKFGEISLNLMMLIQVLNQNTTNIAKSSSQKSYTLNIYIIARAFKILTLIKTLHGDLEIEFYEAMMLLGQLIGAQHNLMIVAINNGFDVNWLTQCRIPKDIIAIHKEVRANGFLK